MSAPRSWKERAKSYRKSARRKDDQLLNLTGQLRTIATHWPGTYTGYCMGCDDEEWPCQVVLDVVVPWMDDEGITAQTTLRKALEAE